MTKLLEGPKDISGVKLMSNWKGQFYFACHHVFRTTKYFEADIDEVYEVSEENYRSAGGTAGWAIAGGLLTGGVGLIAGAAIGARKRKNVIYMVRFKDGKSIAFKEKNTAPLRLFQKYLLKQDFNQRMGNPEAMAQVEEM